MKFIKYLVISLLVISSCKSKKNIINGSNTVNDISVKRLVKKHNSANFNKKTIDAKLKVNYKNEKDNVGLSVRIKIEKDKVIWLKGSKVIQIFKAKITPTKISYYSTHFKNYFEEDFSVIKEILGADINFEQLQNIILGQSLINIKPNKYNLKTTEKSYNLSPKTHKLYEFLFNINKKNFKLNKQLLSNKKEFLSIKYPEYYEKEKEFFPKKMEIKAVNIKKGISNTTDINIFVRSVNFNTELNMPFSIPLGYKEIKL
ncbi:MAG: DUF4292 domain-containing protein [Tenacibaculum sp.]|nr:DUF4292 domain-containing protein [Tenacibaculum sp.]